MATSLTQSGRPETCRSAFPCSAWAPAAGAERALPVPNAAAARRTLTLRRRRPAPAPLASRDRGVSGSVPEGEAPDAWRDGVDFGAALRGHVSGAAGSDRPDVAAGGLERDKEASWACRVARGHRATPRQRGPPVNGALGPQGAVNPELKCRAGSASARPEP